MPTSESPIIICRLTDKNGKILDPYASGSISYTVLCSSQDCSRMQPKPIPGEKRVTVLIEGYITIYIESKDLSPPIPFHIIKHIDIFNPEDIFLNFSVIDFRCCCVPTLNDDYTSVVLVKVCINIDTIVRSCKNIDVMVSTVCPEKEMCINVQRVFDCGRFGSYTCVVYDLLLKATAKQYNAMSDEMQKNYTDEDELTEYGHVGILAPDMVSYHDLYINAMLQSDVNYDVTEGHLDLLTTDAPMPGSPVVLAYVTFEENHGKAVNVKNEYYAALSTGTKKEFVNTDAITIYGDKGIPSPADVSFFNLYVNGVLQPSTNYAVEEGHLQLKTSDFPTAEAMIVLESLYIKDSDNKLLRADVYQYNARSNGNKIYTNSDELTVYGNEGILDPELNSYLNLFINGVLQPQVNYSVQEGRLTLNTTDAPLVGAPVMLQFLRIYLS